MFLLMFSLSMVLFMYNLWQIEDRLLYYSDVISARCNIYILRLCYNVSVCLSIWDASALAHYS